MKKNFILLTTLVIAFLLSTKTFSQEEKISGTGGWKLAGNKLTGGERLGSKNNQDLNLMTDSIIRMVIKNTGLIGVGTTSPNSRFHVNSASGQDAFRVQVSGSTKFFVSSNGGVAVGALATPPSNGLSVSAEIIADSIHLNGGITSGGNLDVSGTVGFGSVETFSDGGANTIESNSDIVPNSDGFHNLGTTARTWSSVHAISYLTSTPPPNSLKSAQNLKAGLPEIMKLRPISYSNGEVQKFALVGTEVKAVLPEVTNETEFSADEAAARSLPKKVALSMDYDALIPVLIKGMQEQQQMIATLQEKVNQLQSQLTAASSDNARSGIKTIVGAILEQNQPNPFNQTTTIRYSLPQGTTGAINIYNASGSLIKSLQANESGQATINASNLKPGTYTYTLTVNGKLAATKKLVLVN